MVRVRPDGGVVLGVGPTLKSESGLVPSSVREVIRSRLSRLSPAATELLAAGAVWGGASASGRFWAWRAWDRRNV